MGTRVLTESLCDRCGLKHVEEGAHGGMPPVAWSLTQLSIRAAGEGWSGGGLKVVWHLCPLCTQAVQDLVGALSSMLQGQDPVTISPTAAYVEATVQPEPEPLYPYVSCHLHAPAPGYTVCPHVLRGALAGQTVPPTAERVGQILCQTGQCRPSQPKADLAPDHMTRLVCPTCAKEKGWIVPGEAAP